jgi:hypothetical protein
VLGPWGLKDARWEPTSGAPIPGAIQAKYPGEHHARQYEVLLLFCDLQAPASARLPAR